MRVASRAVGDLFDGLGGGGIETRCRRRRWPAAPPRSRVQRLSQRGRREAGDTPVLPPRKRVTAAGGFQRIDHIIGGDDTQPGAGCSRALHVPMPASRSGWLRRRAPGRRPAGPRDLKPLSTNTGLGGLDEMRAVMDGDQRLELVPDHTGAGWRRGVRRKSWRLSRLPAAEHYGVDSRDKRGAAG